MTWEFWVLVVLIVATLVVSLLTGFEVGQLRDSIFALRIDMESFVRGEHYENAQERQRTNPRVPLIGPDGKPTPEMERREDLIRERQDDLNV